MHEMALCNSLFDAIEEQAQSVNAVRVTEVDLAIGEVRDIVEDLFAGFFEYLARGTVVEGATLRFTRMPLMVECDDCGRLFTFDWRQGSRGTCPHCGGNSYQVRSGMEFELVSMDVVTPEEAACERLAS